MILCRITPTKCNEGDSTNNDRVQNQLSEVRKLKHDNYIKTKETISVNEKSTGKYVIVVGDSMMNGIKEKGVSKDGNKVKVKYFSGAVIDDVRNNNLKEIIDCKPDVIILYLGTNDAPNKPSNAIIDNLLSLKNSIEKALPNCKVILSSLTPRVDNGKANLTIKHFNDHLKQLKLEILDNSNITPKDLGKKGLHLATSGKAKLARNIVNVLKEKSKN